MNAVRKEYLIKGCIALVMMAMIALCLVNPNEDFGCDCITSGQIVIIEDDAPPLAAVVSKTTTKTSVKKSTKVKKLKKKAKKSKTVTKKNTKKATSTKKSSNKTIKTQKTIVTTTKTISIKKSKKQTIKTTVKTTTRTTTTTAATTKGEVQIKTLASKADSDVLNSFVNGGFKVMVNPSVSYSGVFRSASKMIELKSASTVVYHELGHFVSYRTGRADSTSEFKGIYSAEKSKYTASNKAYVTQSSGEYFAESFKNYTENPSKLKSERPKTYAYVKEKVNQF